MSSAADALERLAVAHAMVAWARGVEAQARAEADAALLEAHETTGATNARCLVGGTDVGSLSVVLGKPKVVVSDASAYEAWLRERLAAGDPRVVERTTYEMPGMPANAGVQGGVVCDPGTGEVIPGCSWVPGGSVAHTKISRCGADEVRAAMRACGMRFDDLDAATLPGGEA